MKIKILATVVFAVSLTVTTTAAPVIKAELGGARCDGGGNDIHDVNDLWLRIGLTLHNGGWWTEPYAGAANYPGGGARGNMSVGGPWVGTAAFGAPRVMNYWETASFEGDWRPGQPCVYWSDEATWNNVPQKMGPYSDLDSFLGADDRGAGQNRIGLAVQQHGMSWEKDPNRDFVLFKYYIYNRSGRDLDDLRLTFVYDFEIGGVGSDDVVGVDQNRSMVYGFDPGPLPPYVGLRLVDGKASGGHAIPWSALKTNDAGRWQEMIKQEWRKAEYPGDWVVILNSGPYAVADDRRFSIGVAVVGGMSLQELQEHADAAYNKYWEIYTGLTEFTARATPRGVSLRWIPDRAYAGYNLYRAQAEDTYAKVNGARITGRAPFEYLDAGLPRPRTYRYKLEAVAASGRGEWFGPVEVELPEARKASFAVAGPRPNPARDKAVFSITLEAPAAVTLAAYDVCGRRVASVPAVALDAGENVVELVTGDLAPGVYLYRVTAGGREAAGKMVVVR